MRDDPGTIPPVVASSRGKRRTKGKEERKEREKRSFKLKKSDILVKWGEMTIFRKRLADAGGTRRKKGEENIACRACNVPASIRRGREKREKEESHGSAHDSTR